MAGGRKNPRARRIDTGVAGFSELMSLLLPARAGVVIEPGVRRELAGDTPRPRSSTTVSGLKANTTAKPFSLLHGAASTSFGPCFATSVSAKNGNRTLPPPLDKAIENHPPSTTTERSRDVASGDMGEQPTRQPFPADFEP